MNRLGRTVALAVPVLLLAACGEATSSPSSADDDTTSPSPTATATATTPSETVTATPAPTATPSQDGPVVLSFNGLEEGSPPAMPYLRNDADTPGGWSLVESDGDVRRLDREYAQFAPMGDGLVGLAYENDKTFAYLLDVNLDDVSRLDAGDGGLAATPDGSIVGWFGGDRRPHFVEDDGAREGYLPEVEGGSSLAALLVDGTTCQEGEGGNGCAAFVNSVDASKAWSAISHGIVDTVPGVISIGDVANGGGMIGMTSIADEGSCWGLFKVWKPKPAWETCDFTLFDFSPSGERILAGPSYLDGFGQGIAAVLDRDGEVLAEWRSHGQATILGTVWEDDDHVLVTAFQDEHSAILRVGLDGSVEFALPPVRTRTPRASTSSRSADPTTGTVGFVQVRRGRSSSSRRPARRVVRRPGSRRSRAAARPPRAG